MYTLKQHEPHVVKCDPSGGITIATADGFELWRGLSVDATKALATRFFFDDLEAIEKTLSRLQGNT